ncbi:SRPBCC family protein [Bacillus sp. 2205SS5-2]|uniref:SRPBCC family protein n=1 Tax=Bacillus sp. 2205SS5-2 TaxID=3109031 RepID=UPI0030054CF9
MRDIFQESVIIHLDPDVVWSYFIDMEKNAPEWMAGISSIEKTTSGPIQEGTIFTFHTRGKDHVTKVTEYVQNNKVTLTSKQGNFQADYTYHFSAENRNTVVTLHVKCKAKGMSKLLTPIISAAIKKTDGRQLEQLQSALAKRVNETKGGHPL